jgi:DNA polymerase V
MRAAQKARQEAEVAGAVHIFMQTDRHRAGAAQKSVSASTTFARPTSDSRAVVEGVMRLFERIWCEGYGWRKAGVLLLDLGAPKTVQPSLFDAPTPPRDGLMAAMDQINARFGRGSAGLGLARKGGQWRMRQDQLSPHYTTRWGDLPRVRVQ